MRPTRYIVALVPLLAIAACSSDSRNVVQPDLSAIPTHEAQLPSLGGGCGDLPIAPDSLRVDRIDPVFSNPTDIENPLFPVGELERALMTGSVGGEDFRSESTKMPGTRLITVDGEVIEAVISQYLAWSDRRIIEQAIDWYAEDDAGNVWYLGENVFDYEDGEVISTEGTWLAGVDGPPAMIMPRDPEVGNVWRPENACPLVFEEVTALEADVEREGPQGPVPGCLKTIELHMDGGTEEKFFAPGYGEFRNGSGPNFEQVALAIPTNSLDQEIPEELDDLSNAAEQMFVQGRRGTWGRLSRLFAEMEEDWDEYRDQGVPPRIAESMDAAMESLEEALAARNRPALRQAAVDLALVTVDFEAQYEDREEVDSNLIELWMRQLSLDISAHDRGGVKSDLVTISLIRARLTGGRSAALATDLGQLQRAAESLDENIVEAVRAKLRASAPGAVMNVAR